MYKTKTMKRYLSMSHPKFELSLINTPHVASYYVTRVAGRDIVTCVIECLRTNEAIGVGSSICHHKDTFQANIGYTIAAGRAVKNWWVTHGDPLLIATVPSIEFMADGL